MSIDDRGFLSERIDAYRVRNRERHPAQYKLADEISGVGQRLLLNMDTPTASMSVLVATFFGRGLQTYQASVLMAERSLLTEAQMLLRSTLETLFYMEASRRHDDFGKALHRDHMKRRTRGVQHAIEAIEGADPERDLSEYREWLAKFRAFASDAEELKILTVAEKAGMGSMYRTLYVQLSNRATHPTIRSIEAHWQKDDDGDISALIWGPDIHTATFHATVLDTIIQIGWALCATMNSVLDNRGIEIALEALQRDYQMFNATAAIQENET